MEFIGHRTHPPDIRVFARKNKIMATPLEKGAHSFSTTEKGLIPMSFAMKPKMHVGLLVK